MSFDSTCSDYDVCPMRSNSCALQFDPNSLENIILSISDQFDFRVVLSDEKTKSALLITGGLAMAGSFIGRHYGGKIGATLGGVVGGACGLGLVAISMRDVWNDIRGKLSELFDLVYDYLAGMGLEDYQRAATFLVHNSGGTTQLANIILETTSGIIGKKILSSLTAA